VCEECGARYEVTEKHFDFLDEKLRHLARVEDTDNVSSFEYDPFALRIIDRYPDGLVLDAGSGLKASAYENVVNLEIVDYPTTDVLGIGESLPFADATFDAALSLAVLEHVRDPFRCVAELARVVRPGGNVYAAVPFLQPYHGYPHHYFNMTLTGLESLFDECFQVEESGTPPYGWPVWTLTWFLNRYIDGLPSDTAKQFKAMKVADLLAPGDHYLADDFVLQLAPEARTEIASVNYVIATRR
jgi:SAM-dependent methyltransferase